MCVFCVRSRRSSGKSTGSGKLAWLSVARRAANARVELGPPFAPSPSLSFSYYNIVLCIICVLCVCVWCVIVTHYI